MESTCFHSCTLLKFHPFSQTPNFPRKSRFCTRKIVTASSHRETHGHQNHRGGRLVDENMIVLRRRIHEMKMVERNYEPPSHWMEWEKRYYTGYDSMVCETVGILQTQLMNMRPSLALGVAALVFFSVPVSAASVGFQLMEIAKGVLVNFHLG